MTTRILFRSPRRPSGLLACLAFLVSCSTGQRKLDLPQPPPPGDDPVDAALVERVVMEEAREQWDAGFTVGERFAVRGARGEQAGWVYPFAIGRSTFPSTERILDVVRQLRERYGLPPDVPPADLPAGFYDDLREQIGDLRSITVGATYGSFPVLVVRQGPHPFYLAVEPALARAAQALHTSAPQLTAMYLLRPHEEYFEFSSGGARVLVHVWSLDVRAPDEVLAQSARRDPEPVARAKREAWAAYDGISGRTLALGTSPPDAHVVVPDRGMIPVVSWTHWCVPTTLAMLAGFWDNYADGYGTKLGYGRVIDYWQDHPGNGTNVPNLMDEMIDHGGTNSWSTAGFLGTLNGSDGYAFEKLRTDGKPSNDYAWGALTAEIDAGRPCLWATYVPSNTTNHAMVAWGYRVHAGQRFVIVYTTWGQTAAQQSAQYSHDEWMGDTLASSAVEALVPGGGTGTTHVALTAPSGGEVLPTTFEITWFVWDAATIRRTEIEFSADGGGAWVPVAAVSNVEGWNHHTWTGGWFTKRARVRIRGLDAAGALVAADGSRGNFQVEAAPNLVPIAGEPTHGAIGFCRLDEQGRLRVVVRNVGSVDAGASRTTVRFGDGTVSHLPTPALAPGRTEELRFDIPPGCWNHDCEFDIEVDSNQQVPEAREDDNFGRGRCIG